MAPTDSSDRDYPGDVHIVRVDGREFIRALALTILIGAGVVVYVALALGLKATSLQDLKSSFKK